MKEKEAKGGEHKVPRERVSYEVHEIRRAERAERGDKAK